MCAAKEQALSVADRACCDAVIFSQKVKNSQFALLRRTATTPATAPATAPIATAV
jgi:hypothetical protein